MKTYVAASLYLVLPRSNCKLTVLCRLSWLPGSLRGQICRTATTRRASTTASRAAQTRARSSTRSSCARWCPGLSHNSSASPSPRPRRLWRGLASSRRPRRAEGPRARGPGTSSSPTRRTTRTGLCNSYIVLCRTWVGAMRACGVLNINLW